METASPESLGFDPDRLARIERWMEGYVADRKFPGASVLIARNGKLGYYADTGLRSVEQDLPWQRDTIVRIYSMTKPIVSAALMTLLEEGHFHLDAPVSEFIPEFTNCRALKSGATSLDSAEPCATPTLHQLLTHTSGLSYSFNTGPLAEEMAERKADYGPMVGTLEDYTKDIADLPLAFHPGQKWNYSIGIDVIGRVIEVVAGKPLNVFLQERIFDPLGMSETSFTIADKHLDRFASLYTPLAGDPTQMSAEKTGNSLRLADEPETSAYRKTTLFSGGGGLLGTIDDYMRFAEMLQQGGKGILSPRTLSFMMRNHLAGDIADTGPSSFAELPMTGTGFGIGGCVITDPGRARMPSSTGDFAWGGMASTFFWVDPVEKLSVVFFTQLAPSSSYPNRAQLKALVHGALTS